MLSFFDKTVSHTFLKGSILHSQAKLGNEMGGFFYGSAAYFSKPGVLRRYAPYLMPKLRFGMQLYTEKRTHLKNIVRKGFKNSLTIYNPDKNSLMGRSQNKIYESAYPYFMTSTFVKGIPLFEDTDTAQILLDSLTFLQEQRDTTLYAYVLMKNHFHIIARGDDLSENMRKLKSYTAREIINLLKLKKKYRLLQYLANAKLSHKTENEYQVWQESFHPKQIIGDQMMIQKIEYIHYNPVKSGYVEQPEDWNYSSARDYASLNGLIPLTLYSR